MIEATTVVGGVVLGMFVLAMFAWAVMSIAFRFVESRCKVDWSNYQKAAPTQKKDLELRQRIACLEEPKRSLMAGMYREEIGMLLNKLEADICKMERE